MRMATGRGRRSPPSALSDRGCTQKPSRQMNCALWKPGTRLCSQVVTALASPSPSDSPKRPRLGRSVEHRGLQNPSEKREWTPFPTEPGNDKRPFSAIQLVADHLITHENPDTTQDSRFLCPCFRRRLVDGKVHGKFRVLMLRLSDASLAWSVDPAAQICTWN